MWHQLYSSGTPAAQLEQPPGPQQHSGLLSQQLAQQSERSVNAGTQASGGFQINLDALLPRRDAQIESIAQHRRSSPRLTFDRL